jgi:hypothetical protein
MNETALEEEKHLCESVSEPGLQGVVTRVIDCASDAAKQVAFVLYVCAVSAVLLSRAASLSASNATNMLASVGFAM